MSVLHNVARGAQEATSKVAILPGEVAIAARNYQNNLSAPLAHDRGAPHTQLGHSVTQAALSARLDQQVSPSVECMMVTPSPRRREAARGAHHAHAERAGRKVCGWGVAPFVQHIPASVAHLIHSLGFCAPPCRRAAP